MQVVCRSIQNGKNGRGSGFNKKFHMPWKYNNDYSTSFIDIDTSLDLAAWGNAGLIAVSYITLSNIIKVLLHNLRIALFAV